MSLITYLLRRIPTTTEGISKRKLPEKCSGIISLNNRYRSYSLLLRKHQPWLGPRIAEIIQHTKCPPQKKHTVYSLITSVFAYLTPYCGPNCNCLLDSPRLGLPSSAHFLLLTWLLVQSHPVCFRLGILVPLTPQSLTQNSPAR